MKGLPAEKIWIKKACQWWFKIRWKGGTDEKYGQDGVKLDEKPGTDKVKLYVTSGQDDQIRSLAQMKRDYMKILPEMMSD